MFDLPEPLGPTITLTPSPNSRRVRSGKDLKPLIVIDFRCTRRSLRRWRVRAPAGRARRARARGVLLGELLAAPGAVRDDRLADERRDREGPVVRRPGLLGDLVGDRLAAAREPLLQRRLEVDRMLERLVDLLGERLDDRRRGALEARRTGSRRRSPPRAPRRARARSRRPPSPPPASPAAPPRAAAPARRAAPRPRRQAGPGDRLRADLRQPAGAEVLGLQARIEVRGDRQREHAVAEEREARVGVAAARGPRGVREDLPVEILRQLRRAVRGGAQRSAA